MVTVDVAPALLSSIQRTIRAEGVLYPRQQAAIVPKIAAPIHKAYVQRGSRVHAGQLLLELENRDLAGATAESRATFDQAQATFETAARATVPQELQKAELETRAAKDALDAQQAIYDNRQRLLQEGAIAEKDVNDARANLSQARTRAPRCTYALWIGAAILGTIAACCRGYSTPSPRMVRWIDESSTGATSTVTTGVASASSL